MGAPDRGVSVLTGADRVVGDICLDPSTLEFGVLEKPGEGAGWPSSRAELSCDLPAGAWRTGETTTEDRRSTVRVLVRDPGA
jgi:hypothetical protein